MTKSTSIPEGREVLMPADVPPEIWSKLVPWEKKLAEIIDKVRRENEGSGKYGAIEVL